jgi:hypothetical protein
MAHRHKAQKRNVGGATAYTGAGSNVIKEAKSTANFKRGGTVSGAKTQQRLASRARGGGAGGSDKNPFSSAGKGFRGQKRARGGGTDASPSDASPSYKRGGRTLKRGGRSDASPSDASPS